MIDNSDDDDIGVGGDISIVDGGNHPRVAIFSLTYTAAMDL